MKSFFKVVGIIIALLIIAVIVSSASLSTPTLSVRSWNRN